MTSIRGAITVTENTKEAIIEASKEMLLEVIKANNLEINQIIDIFFSATRDLDAANPAAAARAIGITEASLFGLQEMYVQGSLAMCLRVLFHVDCQAKVQADMNHVYLKGAVVLRPDLVKIAVAIDGPVGSGKSTIAKEVAQAAGIMYIDTGAMYRAIALYNVRNGTALSDKDAIEASLAEISIDIQHDENNKQRLILNGEDVSLDLRTLAAGEGASIVAVIPAVREHLVTIQRSLAKKYDVVMDGRDIATQVLPNAQVKIYLDASVEERTRRRCNELIENGQNADFEQVRQAIETRDKKDMTREISPLIKADDAIYINTDGMSIHEITSAIISEMSKVKA